MLQFDLQFYEELTVAWVRTVKFISGAFFWPTGQLVFIYEHYLLRLFFLQIERYLRLNIILKSKMEYVIEVLMPDDYYSII